METVKRLFFAIGDRLAGTTFVAINLFSDLELRCANTISESLGARGPVFVSLGIGMLNVAHSVTTERLPTSCSCVFANDSH
jgi:hypothetical protein